MKPLGRRTSLIGVVMLGMTVAQVEAGGGNLSYDQYEEGRAPVTAYFMEIYEKLGVHSRFAEMAKGCGHQKEAASLEAVVLAREKALLNGLLERDAKPGSSRTWAR
jgi:hypothetical protein